MVGIPALAFDHLTHISAGPAKVYTMRGRFRQFFMRVDEFDQFEVQPAHLGVSKDRTVNVFVEAVSTALWEELENISRSSSAHTTRPPAAPSCSQFRL